MRLALGLSLAFFLLPTPIACRSKSKASPADAGRDAASVTAASSGDVPASSAEVDEVLRASRPQLDVCYHKAAAAKPDLAGSAVFKVTVSPDGRVRDATLLGESALDPGLIACARRAIVSAQINPPRGGSSLAMLLPVDFKR